jgi:hypothetical protein
MNEFDTYEKYIELFRPIGCIGNVNSFFYAVNGLNGGMTAGMEYPYDGFAAFMKEYTE